MGRADDTDRPEGALLPPLRPLPDVPLKSGEAFGKKWSAMDRKEKLDAYDALVKAVNEIADNLRTDLDEILAALGSTLRTTVAIKIDVDPNDDPRLP